MLKSAPEVSQEPSREALLAALTERERELAGALERQTATADILKVIASSPSDTRPVFETIAATANRLIGGLSTAVFRYIGDSLHLVAFTPTNPAACIIGMRATAQSMATLICSGVGCQRPRVFFTCPPSPKVQPPDDRPSRLSSPDTAS